MKINRVDIPKISLMYKTEKQSQETIAKKFGVSQGCISYVMKKYGIEVRNRSEMYKGKGNPFYGKKHTEETKYKMRIHPKLTPSEELSYVLGVSAREMLQYELVYLTWLFGYPLWQNGSIDKVSDLDADIYDIANLTMKFKDNVVGHLTVDVISKTFIPECKISCSKGVVIWNAGEGLQLYNNNGHLKERFSPLERITYGKYSNKVKEEPYIKEIETFIKAVKGEIKYPYSLEEEQKRLKILDKLRRSVL